MNAQVVFEAQVGVSEGAAIGGDAACERIVFEQVVDFLRYVVQGEGHRHVVHPGLHTCFEW